MSEDLQLAQHPDADQLSAFAEDALPLHEREHTLAHLAECARCREIVALVMPAETLPEPAFTPVLQPRRESWLRGWRLAWPAAAALAAMALIALHLQQRHDASAPVQLAEQKPQQPLPVPEPGESTVDHRHTQSGKNPLPGVVPASTSAPPPQQSQSSVAMQSSTLDDLPVSNRNQTFLQNSVPPRPVGGPRSQQNVSQPIAQLAPSPAPASQFDGKVNGYTLMTPTPAPQPASGSAGVSSPSVNVTASSADLNLDKLSDAAAPARKLSVLPSGAVVASSATRGSRTLVLDTAGALFVSDDEGRHWLPVASPWQGRAVSLEGRATSFDRPANDASVANSRVRKALSPAHPEISGVVYDHSGAVIPGAAISLTPPGRPTVTTSADMHGRYTLPGVAGANVVEVIAPGFMPAITSVTLAEGESKVSDVTLSVGQISESVTVTAEADFRARKRSPAKKISAPPLPFEVTTDRGERWSSMDGVSWRPVR